MNFKTLPLLLLSLGMLSGCTNSCKGDQNQSPNADQPPATAAPSDSAQVVPTEQDATNSEQAAADESSVTETDTVAAAEQQN